MSAPFRRVWIKVKGSNPVRWRRGWKRNHEPIISRAGWGARKSDKLDRQPGAWRGSVTLVVHHTVTRAASSMTSLAGQSAVRAVQDVHASNRGGIGYHYLASGGRLFEGRGFEVVAAAAFDAARGIGWNRGRYVHVAIPGDYSKAHISIADLRALDSLIYHLGKRGAKVSRIVGHSDLMPTACPGKQGRRDLKAHFGKKWKGR